MFAVSLGLMAVVPTLGLYIGDRFGLAGAELQTWTGLIYAAAPLSAALFGPIWGVLGDRIGRKSMVVRASLGIGVSAALMPLAGSPVALLLLRVLQGIFAGFVAPSMALGTTGIPPERQGVALGRMQLALALGLLVGPAVGAEVAFHFGRASVFYLTSGLSFVSVVPVLLFVREDRTQLFAGQAFTPRTSLAGRFFADLGGLLGNKVFVALLGLVFLMRFGQQMVEPYVALFVRELGPLPAVTALVDDPALALERTIALAFVVLAVAQLLFTTRWGRWADRFGPLRCLAAAGLGLAVAFFFTAVTTDIVTFTALRCVAAFFMAGGMTLAYAAVAGRVRPERRNLAFSLVQSGMQFGLSLGPVIGDAIAAGSGMGGLYFTGGSCLAVAGAGMIVLRLVDVARLAPRHGPSAPVPPSEPVPPPEENA